MQALMKLSRGNATPRTVNWSEENFSPPPVASLISGFRNADVSPPTTLANAAPITTPTAISTTLPRRMNFLNPSSIDTSKDYWPPMYDRKTRRSRPNRPVSLSNRNCTKWKRKGGSTTRLNEFRAKKPSSREPSNAHRHHNIPVLIIVTLSRPQLSRRLRILQLQPHLARAGSFQKVHQVHSIKSDGERLAIIGRLHRIL